MNDVAETGINCNFSMLRRFYSKIESKLRASPELQLCMAARRPPQLKR
jgi:hypothetical protein